MAKIPMWLIGRAVTTCLITPCNLGADGTLNLGTSATLIGRLDEVSIQSRNTTENISPMDSRQANYVITESETTWTLTEILQNQGAAADNILAQAGYGFDYVQVVLARDGKTFTFYGVVGEYNESIRKGKSTGTLTLQQVALTSGINGSTPPTYNPNPNYV